MWELLWLSNLSLYVSQSLQVPISILLTSFDVQLLHNSYLISSLKPFKTESLWIPNHYLHTFIYTSNLYLHCTSIPTNTKLQKPFSQTKMARVFSGVAFLFFGFLGLFSFPAEAAIKKYQFDVGLLYYIITCTKFSYLLCLVMTGFFNSFPFFFQIQVKNVSRLCHAKPIVTVNGRYPGPTIYAREGDRVIINVTNHAQYNMSIHWYVRYNCWSDKTGIFPLIFCFFFFHFIIY